MKVRLSKLIIMLVAICIFSCVTAFGATVGDQLLEPEEGWQRIDDTNLNILYKGKWNFNSRDKIVNSSEQNIDYYHQSTQHNSSDINAEICFKFYGTKFRYIECFGNGRSEKFLISYDGGLNWESFNGYTSSADVKTQMRSILFEKTNLDNKVHSVIIKNGASDYITLDAIDIDGYMLPYNDAVLGIEPQQNKIKLGDNVVVGTVIDNASEIAAEDIYIKYNPEKLQYTGCEEVEGIKLVYNDEKDGELRFILASKGESNIINAKKTLLNLSFKAIASGKALVDITKGRVTDGIEMEKDIEEALCGQATITIEDGKKKDVNNSGEFTLLDLGIDARHFGKDPKAEELIKYNADVAINNAIDDDDLLEIGKLMLANDNYAFNK